MGIDAPRRRGAMLKTVWLLAWPTMLEQFLQTAVQYIDTAMVGAIGTHATAAVGATSTVSWLIGSSVSALAVGFLAFISQSFGAGERERARRAAAQSVTLVLIIGVFFTALMLALSGRIPAWMRVEESIRPLASRYLFLLYLSLLPRGAAIVFGTVLRAVGDTKTPMFVGVGVNVINIVLNFFLIYPTRTVRLLGAMRTLPGAGWGVEGAAAASSVAFGVGGVLITLALWRHKDVSPRGQSLWLDAAILRPCMRVAGPNLLQRFISMLGFVFFASMINSIGEVATAAHTVANTVEEAFYIPGYGMQTAAATLAGNAYGAHDRARLDRLGRAVLPFEVGLMAVSGGLLFVFAPALVRIFSRDEAVIALGSTVLRMVALSEPFYGVSIIVEGMMQGLGQTLPPFLFNVTGMWCVRIAGTFVCTQLLGRGLVSAWGCMIGHNLLVCLLFSVTYLTGRWKPKSLRDEKK